MPPLSRGSRRGSALIASLILLTVIGMIVMGIVSVTMDTSRQADSHTRSFRMRSAAESATSLVVSELWRQFVAVGGGEVGSLVEFRTFMDSFGITDGGAETTLTGLLGAHVDTVGGIEVNSVRASREDGFESTHVRFVADVTALADTDGQVGPRQSVQQLYSIEPAEWDGLEFALLANNVNCIMCHATIDSAGRYYNADESQLGSFSRVKVGTLENLLLRHAANSKIAGTLYVRGIATDKHGTPITNWSSQSLKSLLFDSHGNIVEDAWGDGTVTNLVPADDPPQPLANLYLDYSLDEGNMVDGYLPSEFPPPFPDDGGIDPATGEPDPTGAGNRTVDPHEFYAASQDADGTVSGGTIFVADESDVIDTTQELDIALNDGNQLSLGGVTENSVILSGTADDPIVLNGDVAIDGDVVIQGYVKGSGSLTVSGNIYAPGNVLYMDEGGDGEPRVFGVGAGGIENSLALAAGGSIILGDLFYLSDGLSSGSEFTGEHGGPFGFVLSEVAIFNRGEWAKTQPFLPGAGERFELPNTWTQPNPYYQGPDYVPRFYAFDEDGTVPIFNRGIHFDAALGSWIGREHVGTWNDAHLSYAYPEDPDDPVLYHGDGTPRAAVHSLTTTDGWIDKDQLFNLMQLALEDRDEGEAVEIDALMYSNNSIFGIVGENTPMQGKMIANGGMVASDIGLLVPGGLQLNYDPRTKDLLDIRTSEKVAIRRSAFGVGAP